MSVTDESVHGDSQTRESRYWPIPVLRGVVALAVAVAVTFSVDHSPLLGYLSFGILAVSSGIIIAAGSLKLLTATGPRTPLLAQAIVSIVAGTIALVFPNSGVPFLLFLVSAWAAVTGFLELFVGLRSRRRRAFAKDWLFVGVLTAVFAVAILLIPADFAQHFIGPDKVERIITASVIADGFIGAYAAILGVYLVIAGLSLKWASAAPATVEEPQVSQGGN